MTTNGQVLHLQDHTHDQLRYLAGVNGVAMSDMIKKLIIDELERVGFYLGKDSDPED